MSEAGLWTRCPKPGPHWTHGGACVYFDRRDAWLVRVPFDEAKKRGKAAFDDAYYRQCLTIEEVIEAVLLAALGEGT